MTHCHSTGCPGRNTDGTCHYGTGPHVHCMHRAPPCPIGSMHCGGVEPGKCRMSIHCPHWQPTALEVARNTPDDLGTLSALHARLETFLRSPAAQQITDAERAAMRHQLRAVDDAVYWTRRVRIAQGLPV